jgi:hypothetical protein
MDLQGRGKARRRTGADRGCGVREHAGQAASGVGHRLQANQSTREGNHHPDRDR